MAFETTGAGRKATDQRTRILDRLHQRFGEEVNIMGVALMEILTPSDLTPAAGIWGLLFIHPGDSGSRELVFLHYDQTSWVDMLNKGKRELRDLAYVFNMDGFTLDFVEKPGLLKRLIRSDVGKLYFSCPRLEEREYDGNQITDSRRIDVNCKVLLDLESVSEASAVLREALEQG